MNSNLYNDDCLKIMQQFKDNSIDCIITDPPYFVGFKNDFYDDTPELFEQKVPKWFFEWERILKDNSFLYVFVGVKNLHKWIMEGINAGLTYKNIIATRSFNNGSIRASSNFGFQFQPIIVFSKGSGRKLNEVNFIPTSDAWFNDKRNTNPKIYTYDYPNWIKTEWAFATAKRANKSFHPNEKNVDLIKFLIEVSTNKGDIVLDSFMGCGSTGIASKLCERNFIGIELDKYYFNLSKQRIDSCYVPKKLF